MKLLYVASESYPLIKTGGLGDVAGSLPPALGALGHDVALLLPAYHGVAEHVEGLETVSGLALAGGCGTLLRGRLPVADFTLLLLDAPEYFVREGNPYLAPDGSPWQDNAQRFALLARAAVAVALDRAGLSWTPDLIHCNDWQTALAPALLAGEPTRPATVFTVHNLAYQGLFPAPTLRALGLPPGLWSMDGLEFHGNLSFMKGGLLFADRITTVSPTYAREIQTPEHGAGLDGLLRHRAADLSGIMNGIDDTAWNPATDPHLMVNYDADSVENKHANRTALRNRMQLPDRPELPVVGMVGRLVEQKGVDLTLDAMPNLTGLPLQIVVLGSGDKMFETALLEWTARYPDRIAVHIGFDEDLAHLIEAGADMFLMPSRFEPCGLNQMYSLRYGTVPVVRATGGLADTVIDATEDNLSTGTANGITFTDITSAALVEAVKRALALERDATAWRTLQERGMSTDFSWDRRAREYVDLYEDAIREREAP